MDDILASVSLGHGRSVHLAALARDTVVGAGAEHLGFEGYFLFEADEAPGRQGINILGKAASFEAALRMIDVFRLFQRSRYNPAESVNSPLFAANA